MAEYIIQKAVELGKVVKGRRLTLEQYGEQFYAQNKYDGCCAVIDVEAGVVRSRTGEFCRSMGAVVDTLRRIGYTNEILIGEAWTHGVEFNVLSGWFRQHAPEPRLGFVINDVLTQEEWAAGHSDFPWPHRFRRALDTFGVSPPVFTATTYEPGSYGHPQAVCDALVGEGGYDGLILRDPFGTWTVGRGTTGEIVKVKRKLSFDLRVTAIKEGVGEKTGRSVYTLDVAYNNRTLSVGSGVPHSRSDLPAVGDIVEVEAMDYSSDGLLREPRYKGIRYDKLEADA